MSIDDLAKEIEGLKKERENMIANLNAIGGAIQFAEQLAGKMRAQAVADTPPSELVKK
jgi:hypothetical protein